MILNKKYKIFDIHTHIFPDNIAKKAVESIGRYYNIDMWENGTVDALLESGRQIGVDRYLVHSSATHSGQVKAINDYIAGVINSHSNMIGFGTLHLDFEDVEAEIERIISLGLRGIKLHPEFQHFVIDEPAMMPIYKAIEGKLPLLIHMGDQNQDSSSPIRLARVLDKFPGLVVIAAHFGGYRMWEDSRKYLFGSNIFMDTSSSLPFLEPAVAVDMIRSHGIEKFMFGSDYPMWRHSDELDRFLKLDLSEAEREAILYNNAANLFGEA
ncbi:MAG: amidohydrolase family protein [Acetivibrionales bacterium]|mgnify:FL=1|nr:amidohydrolase [Clostridiaceae bacterium]